MNHHRGANSPLELPPGTAASANLIGRRVGDRIGHEMLAKVAGEREHWSFASITETSFLWTGEVSRDGGKTWFLRQEMRGSRRKAP